MLLCELHAHTTWSDGELTVTELVDLYGMHGFDVLCVTDHLLRSEERSIRLRPDTYPHYVKTIERESRRASEQYGLLLIPGAELTHVAADPDEAGHALAVGLRSFCSVDEGLEPRCGQRGQAEPRSSRRIRTAERTIPIRTGRRGGSGGTTSGSTGWSIATSS